MRKTQQGAGAGRVYDFEVETIDGKSKPLSDYKGQVLLLVNTASLCGFTPQYDSLEEVHKKFVDKGFKVLAFPANEFGAQEPGTNEQIKEFCRTRFSISFDLFGKIRVKGEGLHPLYRFLTTESGHNGDISWNFTKFLVDREGRVAGRFGPHEEPASPAVVKAIEALL